MRVLVGHELGFHRNVAGLSAEADGFGGVVGLVAAEGGQEEEPDADDDEASEHAPVPFLGQVDAQNEGSRITDGLLAIAALEYVADQDQPDPGKEESGCHHIGQDPHIGVGAVGEHVDREQQDEGENGASRHQDPEEADPVSEESWGAEGSTGRGRGFGGLVTHGVL